jgi:LTXXQ motif family protein
MMRHLTHGFGGALAATAILGAVLLNFPSAAMAQPAPASAGKATRMADRVEARIKSLHDGLKITAAQEPQWQAVADVMRENARAVGALIEEREAKAKTETAVDDLHAYSAIADAHAAGIKKLAAAFETLYASLSDAQKKEADSMFRHRPHPHHHHAHAKKAG